MATVLVVDDSADARQLLRSLLEHRAHGVVEAEDGAEGLRLARDLHPDLVITDVLLPSLNGYELARDIRTDRSMVGTRVLLTTAATVDAGLLDLARRCGVMSVIPKPSEPLGILAVIDDVLQSPAPPVLESARPVDAFEADQLRVLTAGLAKKIDELNAANDDLHRSEAQFRRLLELAPAAIVGVDGAGRVRLVNALAEAAFGYDRAELLGEPVETLVPETLRAAHVAHRADYAAWPSVRPMGVGRDLEARRKDGTHFPVTVSLSTVGEGHDRMVLAAVLDVSDRVRGEKEREQLKATLARAQRLESIGQLAGGIAHDFNNLLAVIINYADFVSMSLGERSEITDDVSQIRLAATRAADLVRQLLLFSRGRPAKAERCHINHLLDDLKSLLDRTIGEHITLNIRADGNVPPVLGDRSKLEQVVVNLIVNARDAMPDGGRIDVEAGGVEVGTELQPSEGLPPGSYVRLAVRDAGSGMTQEVQDRAFDPFFTTKARGQGTGLGLATVYGIVTEAGGHIRLRSELGRGTEVSIYLPALRDHAGAPVEDPVITLPTGHGELVLVVEDESGVLDVVRRILERNHYTVVSTTSARDALAMAADLDTAPALIVSDVVMPGLSGPELIALLRDRWPAVPALLMSGYLDDIATALVAGADVLYKPFTESELLGRVRRVLDGSN